MDQSKTGFWRVVHYFGGQGVGLWTRLMQNGPKWTGLHWVQPKKVTSYVPIRHKLLIGHISDHVD